MKLRDLEAQFVRREMRKDDDGDEYNALVPVDTLAEAEGIRFLCPKCFAANGGKVGTHGVFCWFNGRGVDPAEPPGPGRWNPQGTGYDDLTFVGPGAVSVQLLGGCGWHGFVKDGDAS